MIRCGKFEQFMAKFCLDTDRNIDPLVCPTFEHWKSPLLSLCRSLSESCCYNLMYETTGKKLVGESKEIKMLL